MKDVDYILLLKHFRGETTDDENAMIVVWKEQNVVNSLTYKRQFHLFQHTEETKIWKNILSKITKEDSLQN